MSNACPCRCYNNGSSLVLSLPPAIKNALGVVTHDVLICRVMIIQGRPMLIGEKLPMHKFANPTALPADVLPKKADNG